MAEQQQDQAEDEAPPWRWIQVYGRITVEPIVHVESVTLNENN